MAIGAIIGAAGSLYGAAQGQRAAQEQSDAAARAQREALARLASIDIPTIQGQIIQPEMLQYLGNYAPELLKTYELDPTAFEQISVDPRLAQMQQAALEQVAGIAEQGGLTNADLAAIEQSRRSAASEDQAKQGQILQQMAARGQGGSGAELIARLQSSQSAADRMSAEGLQVAQMAQQRALEAMARQGQMAGSIRGQEYGEQSDLARARDIATQAAWRNRQDVARANIEAQNAAARRNLDLKQQLSSQNIGTRNMAEQYNKNLQQTRFANEMARATGQAGILQGEAKRRAEMAGTVGQGWQNIGTGVGNLAGGIADMAGSKKK